MPTTGYVAFFWQPVKSPALTLLKGKTFMIGDHGEMWEHSALRAEQDAWILPGKVDKKSRTNWVMCGRKARLSSPFYAWTVHD